MSGDRRAASAAARRQWPAPGHGTPAARRREGRLAAARRSRSRTATPGHLSDPQPLVPLRHGRDLLGRKDRTQNSVDHLVCEASSLKERGESPALRLRLLITEPFLAALRHVQGQGELRLFGDAGQAFFHYLAVHPTGAEFLLQALAAGLAAGQPGAHPGLGKLPVIYEPQAAQVRHRLLDDCLSELLPPQAGAKLIVGARPTTEGAEQALLGSPQLRLFAEGMALLLRQVVSHRNRVCQQRLDRHAERVAAIQEDGPPPRVADLLPYVGYSGHGLHCGPPSSTRRRGNVASGV